MKKAVTVKQTEGEEIPTEVLAIHIQQISNAMATIRAGRLNEKALVLLIQDYTKLPRDTIKLVLESLDFLGETYLKPKAKKP